MRSKSWLVLTAKNRCNLRSNSSQSLPLCVNHIPLALNFMRLSVIRLHCFSSMSFLLRCATTAHRVSFFKSASLYAAGFLRRRASSGLDFPSWRCLHLAFTGLLKANFYSLRFQPLRSQWGMCAHLGLLRDFHTDCTIAAPPRTQPRDKPSPTDVRTRPTRPAELATPCGKPRRAMPANPVPLALPPPSTACSPAAFACGDNLLSGLPITRYSEPLILWCRR